jgi:DNA-binding Lrp family transcriptional regulator
VRPRDTEKDHQALADFRQRKIMTISELSNVLGCSATTTRRRLREWQAYTSYNMNGRYHALAAIAEFNKKGLWHYRGVYFSKHGTLKKTIIYFVTTSQKGLSNSDLAEIIGTNPQSFMPQYKQLPELRREREGRQIVYYSSDPQRYEEQRKSRFPPQPSTVKLPPDALSVLILVERIQNPRSSISELSRILSGKGQGVGEEQIQALLEYHGLQKKTPGTTP